MNESMVSIIWFAPEKVNAADSTALRPFRYVVVCLALSPMADSSLRTVTAPLEFTITLITWETIYLLSSLRNMGLIFGFVLIDAASIALATKPGFA